MIRISSLLLMLSFSASAFAHRMEIHDNDIRVKIAAAASFSWYSKGSADKDGHWRIPGLLMGGEALPVEEGFAVDDALLWGNYRLHERLRLQGKLGVHGGGDSHHSDISLENLYLDYQIRQAKPLTFSLGLMDARFSPLATHHASMDDFTETPLLIDAFFGRGGHDKGLRLKWELHGNVTLGAEIWDGETFPATDGKDGGAQDVYLKLGKTLSGWKLQSGLWAMQADAVQRGDERYADGHSHGNAFATQPADIRFSGDSELSGLWFSLSAPRYNGVQAGIAYEAMQSKASGEIFDATRKAAYRQDHLGYRLSTHLDFSPYRLSYRYEKLSLENHLDGSAAPFLAEDANLLNSRNPERQTLQLQWQIHKKLGLRAAYTKDNALPEESDRYQLGVVWQDVLYEKR